MGDGECGGCEYRRYRSQAELLRLCRQYASDCDTRISRLLDVLDEANTSEEEQRDLMAQAGGQQDYSDVIDQIDHWRATKRAIENALADATGAPPSGGVAG